MTRSQVEIEQIEIDLLLDALFRIHGYDFRNYARASLKRRICHRLIMEKLEHISELIPRLVRDQIFVNRLLADLSISVTEMFREPNFFNALRETVLPILRTFPFFKIWHAGCASGEEVYSLAILLQEEGLYERAKIYATDVNNHVLSCAREGLYREEYIREFRENYQRAGGKRDLMDYFLCKYGSAKIDARLRKKITFASHNLVTDGVFGEMQLIICRNVLIYFNKALKKRVINLFCQSLYHGGLLCLGNRESLEYLNVADKFHAFGTDARIYKKVMEVPKQRVN